MDLGDEGDAVVGFGVRVLVWVEGDLNLSLEFGCVYSKVCDGATALKFYIGKIYAWISAPDLLSTLSYEFCDWVRIK